MHAVAYRQAQAMWHDSHAVIRNSMALSRAARHALHGAPERSSRHWWVTAASVATAAGIVLAVFLSWPFVPAEPPPAPRYATLAAGRPPLYIDHRYPARDDRPGGQTERH